MPTTRRFVVSSMTSRDYDVALMKSQYSKSRIRKQGPRSTIRVNPLSAHYRRTLC